MPSDLTFVAGQLRPFLADLLATEQSSWKEYGAPWWDAVHALGMFLDGGKALRPRFCYWGYVASTDTGPGPDLVTAAAAVELLHAFALIHDDLMDASPTRRGRPALHEAFTAEHRCHGWAGEPGRYGAATALLTGDLAFALAGRLAGELPGRVSGVWGRLISELTAGQFLDLAGAARRDRSAELAATIARLKSGRYTVTGPLRLGAALAGPDGLAPALAQFGDLVGEAFQLRDDLLGAFGDPQLTGKPVGEDLRSGKPTLLVAYTAQRVGGPDTGPLRRIGAADLTDAEVAAITALIDSSGARARVEQLIESNLRTARGLVCGADLPPPVREALCDLATAASQRSH